MENSSNEVNVARTLTPVATLAPWSNAMRAHKWFAANAEATPSRMTIAVPGDSFASMRSAIIVALAVLAQSGFACEYPDQGNMPLRRAVTRVEMVPEVAEWHREMVRNGVLPQYVVRLDEPRREGRKCFWPVEVRAQGKLWWRYLVTPDGKTVREQ